MSTFVKHIKHLRLPFFICLSLYTGLTGCQLPKEWQDPHQNKEQKPQNSCTTNTNTTPCSTAEPQERSFKKVTQEEKDRAEREEYDRKQWQEAFETLRAFS